MSLADELSEKQPRQLSPTDQWVLHWYGTLSKEDQEAWDQWLADPKASPSAGFRVIKKRGYPLGNSGFIKWVRTKRESGS